MAGLLFWKEQKTWQVYCFGKSRKHDRFTVLERAENMAGLLFWKEWKTWQAYCFKKSRKHGRSIVFFKSRKHGRSIVLKRTENMADLLWKKWKTWQLYCFGKSRKHGKSVALERVVNVAQCHIKLLQSQHPFCVQHIQLCTMSHHCSRHKHRVHVCLAVTCHLLFWQNEWDLLCATGLEQTGIVYIPLQ